MDFFTLSEAFLPRDNVGEYISAIWTERFSTAGDVQLVVPASADNVAKLTEGTFLGLPGSMEVMQLGTQSIEKGLLTVVGKTLENFLNERVVWFRDPAYTVGSDTHPNPVADYTSDTMSPSEFIAHVVDKMVINPDTYATSWANVNLDWANEVLPNLTIGSYFDTIGAKRLSIPIGPLYDGISAIAQAEGIGIHILVMGADPVTGYDLRLYVREGADHTSDGAEDLVRLAPDLNTIRNLKEVRSIDNYKNVCYVYYKGVISTHLADPLAPSGFARRSILVQAASDVDISLANEPAFREQVAQDALANHNYVRAVDGESNPSSQYRYGVDYSLGDLIELESLSGTIAKARVTEFIRAHDNNGYKEYPTISVVTPTGSGGGS